MGQSVEFGDFLSEEIVECPKLREAKLRVEMLELVA
jgi:hypothetical protein